MSRKSTKSKPMSESLTLNLELEITEPVTPEALTEVTTSVRAPDVVYQALILTSPPSDGRRWFAKYPVGTVLPFLRIEQEDCFSREADGFTNIVPLTNAKIVEFQNEVPAYYAVHPSYKA